LLPSDLVTPKTTKTVTKMGRTTLRKNGVAFTPAEKMRRYRQRQRQRLLDQPIPEYVRTVQGNNSTMIAEVAKL
jgi:hypothetical protein